MASSYTDIGTELMTTGENAGNWGTKTNTNLQIIEQISGGFKVQTLNAGGAGANTSVSGNVLTIASQAEVKSDTTPELGGSLNASGNDISNVNTLTASNFSGALTGNVQGLVYGVDIRNIEPNTAGFDFGSLSNDVRGLSDWLIYETDIDFGQVLTPDVRNFDAGILS